MFSSNNERQKWQMMELPDGISTSEGNWYHITDKQIRSYIPGLLDRYPLKTIIKEADVWVRSADGLSLFLFFVLVYLTVDPLIAAVCSVVFFFIWFYNTSAFVFISATPLVKALTNDGFVYVGSAILMMGIAFNGSLFSLELDLSFTALWYAIALFFLLKVGLLRLLIRLFQARTARPAYMMSDRILNMLLIRYAMKTGKLPENIEKMEDELIRIANYHKNRATK